MNITLSNDLLDMIDTRSITGVPTFYRDYFHMPSGQEHYRLLIHLCYCWDGTILTDIGTHKGASALALAQNPKNMVMSYDLTDQRENDIGAKNTGFRWGDFRTDVVMQEYILKSSVVMLDIDNAYENEIWLYQFLLEHSWKGIMICGGIHHRADMKKFWEEVKTDKIDLTRYGHGTGTGVVLFGDDVSFRCI